MKPRRVSLAIAASVSMVLGWGVPALALPPAPSPYIEAYINPQQQMIFGHDWADLSVDVSVNGSTVGTGVTFPFITALAPGDQILVTGNPSGVTAALLVAEHTLTAVNLASDTAAGTATPDPVGEFAIWATEPSSPRLTPTFNAADHTWAIDFGAASYDLRQGPALQLRQADAEGDATVTLFPIPNPMVELWDTHGVAASGWQPDSPLTLTIDDPTDGQPPMEWGVTTRPDGTYWDAMPAGWDPLLPGWIATATGYVPYFGTITKTLTVPDPIFVPDFNGWVVSGAVDGVLTDQDVGRGSQINVIAWCEGGTQQGTTRSATTDPVTGTFSLDMSVYPPPPGGGFGEQCTGPIQNVLYRLYDADADMWQAWWQPSIDPQVEVLAEFVDDGQWVDVAGRGWDLTTVSLVQCKTDFGPPVFPEGCDWGTLTQVLSSPGGNWPYDTAGFEAGFWPQAVIDTGSEQVDCTATSCAVVGFEPWRPDAPMAWAGLNFAPNVDVTAGVKGTVSNVTGSATISGTVTASAPTDVRISGELRQRLGRTRVVVGWFEVWVYVDEPGTAVSWTAVVDPQTGQAFGSGKGGLTVFADLGYEGSPSDQDAVTVSLSIVRKQR